MDLGFQGVVCILYGAKIYAMDVPCVQRPARKAQLYRIKRAGQCLMNLSACIVAIVSGLVRQTPGRIRRRVGWCVLAENMAGIREWRMWLANFLPDSKVNDFISATLKWYKENGKTKERIGTVIDRVGLDKFKKKLQDAFR